MTKKTNNALKKITVEAQTIFQKAFVKALPHIERDALSAIHLKKIVQHVETIAHRRQKNEALVKVFKLDCAGHISTAIVVVNDDMPFLVDSVSAELIHQKKNIELLLHPILSVKRDSKGHINTCHPYTKEGEADGAESLMFIQLEQLLTTEAMAILEQTLSGVLEDVRLATSDWQAMRKCADSLAQKMNDDENAAFMNYTVANNFTFLGYAEYEDGKKVKNKSMGVLSKYDFFNGQKNDRAFVERELVITKLIDQKSTVHRRVPFDVILIPTWNEQKKYKGYKVLLGLFTSSTYSCRTSEVPLVRSIVKATIQKANFKTGSHDAKALEHILEKFPRDELFQFDVPLLYQTVLGILRLQERQRIALFTRMDALQNYVTCLVYVPRDRYDTHYRTKAELILKEYFKADNIASYVSLDDSPLARVRFQVRLPKGKDVKFDADLLEKKLVALGQYWIESLKQNLIMAHGKVKGSELYTLYENAFPIAYQENISAEKALLDIQQIESLKNPAAILGVDLYERYQDGERSVYLKIYHENTPVPLSDILPILEHMGFKSLSETPYEVKGRQQKVVWIHDFALAASVPLSLSLHEFKAHFEEALIAIWRKQVEDDPLNQLITLANFSWRDVVILRTYNAYIKQIRFPYSRQYIEQTLALYPEIARAILDLFHMRHDPAKQNKNAKAAVSKLEKAIEAQMMKVSKLDHDRILRKFYELVSKTLRTNYYQKNDDGSFKDVLAFKLDSQNMSDLPLPKPHVEIFVYSPRVEAVHLRGGKIARGGLRWSDRHDDFRTEVLALVKAQSVKNAIIVPVGAKGGFVVKRPPITGGRDAYLQEGIACYKLFINALLDVTDNIVAGKIVPPKNVVRHDQDDPYLVVAADKGTASFSDIANSISLARQFWLFDAFASGGSAGYDHKGMGITARGAWEGIKRHFREIGKDIQTEDFIVTGVGDMSGDVFGNGMLLSKHIRLVAAFNHNFIFCDPNPDAAKSFAERKRMFEQRLDWDKYNPKLLSAGGKIFSRSEKALILTPEIKKLFGFEKNQVTPDELMKAILLHPSELLYFGGIGTYIKSSRQSQADADDKANDGMRVDARDVRAKVIGEGANLGLTQAARVEFAHAGGLLNPDFIDNSGGVDCSDHEVNIKILCSRLLEQKKLTLEKRNQLLKAMTDNVAELVLHDNYQQTQSLSVFAASAASQLEVHAQFMRDCEKKGIFRRHLEGLPDDEMLAQMSREGRGLSRPELAVLSAYGKIVLYNDLLTSDFADDKALLPLLYHYFPKPLQKFDDAILNHRLKNNIIYTVLANDIVNRMGAVFVSSRIAKTGKTAIDVAKAYVVIVNAFDVGSLWKAVEKLDAKVSGTAQIKAHQEIFQMVKRLVTWLLRSPLFEKETTELIKILRQGVEMLLSDKKFKYPSYIQEMVKARFHDMKEAGLPDDVASLIGAFVIWVSIPDIVSTTQAHKRDLKSIARDYFMIGEELHLDWVRDHIAALKPDNQWQARVISGMLDELFSLQATILKDIYQKKSAKAQTWLVTHRADIDYIYNLISTMKQSQVIDFNMLVYLVQRLKQLV